MSLLPVYQTYVGKAVSLLMRDEAGEVRGLGFALSEHKIATSPVVQVGIEFLLKCLPALDGFNRQECFCRMPSLAANSACAGPGGSRGDGNLGLFQDEDLPSLSCQVVSDGTAHYTSADDEYFNVEPAHGFTCFYYATVLTIVLFCHYTLRCVLGIVAFAGYT
jgi:hypothetical protein